MATVRHLGFYKKLIFEQQLGFGGPIHGTRGDRSVYDRLFTRTDNQTDTPIAFLRAATEDGVIARAVFTARLAATRFRRVGRWATPSLGVSLRP